MSRLTSGLPSLLMAGPEQVFWPRLSRHGSPPPPHPDRIAAASSTTANHAQIRFHPLRVMSLLPPVPNLLANHAQRNDGLRPFCSKSPCCN
jgi:hypothetical protein